MTLTRRSFLRAFGIGTAAAAVAPELLVEPARKLWFVPSNAPVGSRVERAYAYPVKLRFEHGYTYNAPTPLCVSPKTYEELVSEFAESAQRRLEMQLLYGTDEPPRDIRERFARVEAQFYGRSMTDEVRDVQRQLDDQIAAIASNLREFGLSSIAISETA